MDFDKAAHRLFFNDLGFIRDRRDPDQPRMVKTIASALNSAFYAGRRSRRSSASNDRGEAARRPGRRSGNR